jgi:hypothetical protein
MILFFILMFGSAWILGEIMDKYFGIGPSHIPVPGTKEWDEMYGDDDRDFDERGKPKGGGKRLRIPQKT